MKKDINVSVTTFNSLEELTKNVDSILEVKVTRIISAYKGSQEMDEAKINKMAEGFKERGFIKMREQERILFGTNIKLNIPEVIEGKINTHPLLAIYKGLRVIGPNLILDNDEVLVMIHNDSMHLSQLDSTDIVAMITFSPIMNLDFSVS